MSFFERVFFGNLDQRNTVFDQAEREGYTPQDIVAFFDLAMMNSDLVEGQRQQARQKYGLDLTPGQFGIVYQKKQ